jgi:putative hemolysin
MLGLQVAVIVLLMLLNGLFAMAEMALVSSRKARLQHAADRGREGARIALELKADPSRLLSTVQIGITVTGILAGTFGGATLGESLAEYLRGYSGIVGDYAHAISISVVVISISYLSLIIGELVPKRVALSHPEAIAATLAGLMKLLSRIAAPAEWLLSASSNAVLRLLPLRSDDQAPVTEEEINLMLREGAAAGHFHEGETAIVQMALRLGDRRVSAVMTPRTQVEWVDLQDGEAEHREKLLETAFSRLPVFDGGAQHVIGVIDKKDLLGACLAGQSFTLKAALRPPLFLPNTVTALRALEMFKKSGEPMALVVDEYGDFEGVVTLNDILQAGRRHRQPGRRVRPDGGAARRRLVAARRHGGGRPGEGRRRPRSPAGRGGRRVPHARRFHDGAGQPRSDRRRPFRGRRLPVRGGGHGRAAGRSCARGATQGQGAPRLNGRSGCRATLSWWSSGSSRPPGTASRR